ncbi:MAG: DUF2163 domain-containing protein [Pseudomonadota bacterium]
MRDLDPALLDKLNSGATTLCRCWRLTREDGVVIGFTDHDGDISFESTVFSAASGLVASALAQSLGLSVDNTEVVGALTSAGLLAEDLAAGRYDAARLEHWLVDWSDPALRVRLFDGEIGEITRGKSGFEAELRGLNTALNRPVGRVYLRDCDAVFGDARCALDPRDPQFFATAQVAAVDGPTRVAVTGLGGYADGWFARGRLDWTLGRNAGLVGQVRRDVVEDGQRWLELWEAAPAQPAIGDTVEVIAGCDKRAATCRDKFANLPNFRGFPHMPGEDWVNGYAQNGERHDGSSLFS